MTKKIKAYLVLAGTMLMMIVTLGGYARYQKRRADKAKKVAAEHQRIAEHAEMIQQRIDKADKDNYKKRRAANEHKNNRSYFDNL